MDQWLKTGTVGKRKTTESNDSIQSSHETQSSITQPVEENPKKLPRVSNTKLQELQSGKIRRYCEEYLSYGFLFIIIENVPRPECVICGEVLSNESMKPSLLTRHLQNKHLDFKDKNVTFFKRLLENKNKCNMHTYLSSSGSANEDALEASFRISYRTVKNGKNHTIGENLFLPRIKDAVSCVFGKDYVHKINAIPLSNDTVSRRIKDISYERLC